MFVVIQILQRMPFFVNLFKTRNLTYKSILVTTLITFFVNAVGCTILVTKPFGIVISRKVAVAIFVSIFVYALIRFIIYLRNYGQLTKKLALSVYKKKSIYKGVSDFVCREYRYLAYLFNGLEIVKSVVPELKDIPNGPQIVKTFKNHYRKRIILFSVFFVLYSLLIMATKFILLEYKKSQIFHTSVISWHTPCVIIYSENDRRSV